MIGLQGRTLYVMPVITKLGFQKNQKRVNVHLDGQFAFGLATAVVLKKTLKTKQRLSHNEIKKLLIFSWQEELYEQVLYYLSLRPRSRKEIADYVKRRFAKLKKNQKLPFFEHQEVVLDTRGTLIDETVARLEKNDLLNDEDFARWFVDQRVRLKPKGKKALSLELRQKGVDKEIISQVLADENLYPLDKEKEAAYQVGRKAFNQLQSLLTNGKKDMITLRRRLYQRLASRGFSYDLVKTVVDDLLTKE